MTVTAFSYLNKYYWGEPSSDSAFYFQIKKKRHEFKAANYIPWIFFVERESGKLCNWSGYVYNARGLHAFSLLSRAFVAVNSYPSLTKNVE